MSEQKHTPGPWVWLGMPGQSVLNAAAGRVLDYAPYEGMWLGAYDNDRDEANAHLIAAAPDLLAACKAALDWVALDGDGISDPTRSGLLAAIAKAEGRK